MTTIAVSRVRRRPYLILCVAGLATAACGLRAQEPDTAPEALVAGLEFEDFKQHIHVLSGFGDREQGSESFTNAANWIERKLSAAGYTVERHEYSRYFFLPRYNLYVTKVGATNPDDMYIVAAHLDGRGGGGAADDDASGVALVLEAALAMAPDHVRTDTSVRFIFWDTEETGADGSRAYVMDRAGMRGDEIPRGSGRYPEPNWLGMIQHDMLLFDHGLPAQPEQIPGADIDIEYQQDSDFAAESRALAQSFHAGNAQYSTDYPAEIGSNMRYTDSWRFENMAPAISIRENQRMAEIGEGSNPHWHESTDVAETYSEADYRLGFNALQMTLGTVADLAGARIVRTDGDAD